MYLKSLVLKGFKSFADRSVLTFEPGITAVVGPNGSGKSNISDGVLWVLGERNVRNLRGQTMEDVIFAGSSARKPVSVAEVELVLDNSDGILPVDYSEVSIGRRMYRSGESEYLINGTVARRMDVLDILHDSGLGTGTHSIIAQGHLSNILASKPEDRRALVEEAAGVLKHKQRKARSQRKLERMDDHLTRVKDITGEIERQLRPLQRKAKRVMAYREVARELADVKLQLAVDDLRVLQRTWDDTRVNEEASTEKLAALRENIITAEAEAEALQKRLADESAISQAAEQQYRRAQALRDRLDSQVALLHERKRNLTSYLGEQQMRKAQDERGLLEATSALEQAQTALDHAVAQRTEADRALEEATEKTAGLQARKRELQNQADTAQRLRRDRLQELEGVRASIARTREILASNRAQEQLIAAHEKELAGRRDEARRARDAAVAAVAQATAALEEARENEAAAREAQGQAVTARDDAREALERARDARSTVSAQVKGLEELVRARRGQNPLRAWMLDTWEGDAIPLIDEISADPQVEALVEMLLGADVDDVFVDDAATAAAAVTQLSASSMEGTLSVLPRNAMRPVSAAKAGTPLVDLMTFSEAAAPAVLALLGNVMVCETVAQAQEAARAGAVGATRQGAVAWPNGKLTFMRRPTDAAQGALATHRALEETQAALAQAAQQVTQAEAAVAQAEEHLRSRQSASLAASQTFASARGALESAQAEQTRCVSALASVEKEAQAIAKQRDAAQAALAEAEPQAASLDERARLLESVIAEADDELERTREALAPVRTRSDDAMNELAEAKLAAATCKERTDYAVRMKLTREHQVKTTREALARIEENIRVKSIALQRIDPLLVLCEELAAHARTRTQGIEEESAASQAQTAELHARINEARARTKAAHDAYDAENETVSAVRVKKGRLEMQVEAAIRVITDDCKSPLETALALPELADRSALEETSFKLQRRIANMGTINPDAAAEYEQLKERFDYLSAQMNDMMAARRSLARIAGVIDARMRDDFVRTFEQVNDNFKEIFAQLFPGGHGSLTMVDPSDPENTGIEVNAQPSGKRITQMSLMSGGEKSLVALALLFAVYKTRSTPFYVLDEVEAALDDTNLRRMLAYLDTIRSDTQLIIITHQRRTMEMANVLYGISMQKDGVTKVMSQRLDQALKKAEG